MSYSKKDFVKELKTQLDLGYNPERIGGWAHTTYLQHCGEIDPVLQNIILDLSFLEEGPEFEVPIEKLMKLVDQLMVEGEKEELEKAASEITDTAAALENDWLMCPICVDAWQTDSQDPMVRCPKYEQILHNPRFKTK